MHAQVRDTARSSHGQKFCQIVQQYHISTDVAQEHASNPEDQATTEYAHASRQHKTNDLAACDCMLSSKCAIFIEQNAVDGADSIRFRVIYQTKRCAVRWE